MNLPQHFSVSQLNRFLTCPLSYRFRYIDKIHTDSKTSSLALGSAFHAAAERLHNDIIAGEIKEAADYQQVFHEAAETEFGCFDIQMKKKEDRQSLLASGLGLVELYYDYRLKAPGRLVAAEKELTIPLMDIRSGEVFDRPLMGYLDLVEDGPVIVDLKTACRTYAEDDVAANLQLTAYAYMTYLQTGQIPRLRIDAVIKTKTPKLQQIETTRSEDDFGRFFKLVKAVMLSIRTMAESDGFYPNRGWSCPMCEYAGHCRRWSQGGDV